MPKIQYESFKFSQGTLEIIDKANAIIDEYIIDGFDLTLRQLYYQFVSRGFIPNKQSEYKRLGDIINNARLAGMVDWNAITDRTRFLRSHSYWRNPSSIISSAAQSYRVNKWANQETLPEVWIEKDALVGVIEDACDDVEIPYFSCRGYVSQSEMWAAAQRIQARHEGSGQKTVIIHLGDHDPSGIDMTRDIEDRIKLFLQSYCEESVHYWEDLFEIRRIALNMAQVEEFSPPPNPAKTTDSRYQNYINNYGTESWELDALDPRTLSSLIRNIVYEYRDMDKWEEKAAYEQEGVNTLEKIRRNYDKVSQFVNCNF